MENNIIVSEIVARLRRFLPDLENGDSERIEKAAGEISSTIIARENNLEHSGREFSEIEELALDLEVPKGAVENYDSKLKSLSERIRSLQD